MKIDLQRIVSDLSKRATTRNVRELRKFVIQAIQRIGIELKERRSNYTENENNTNYVVAVSLRGVLDYVNLVDLTSEANWENNHQMLEAIWIHLCDCRERLATRPQGLSGPLIDEIHDFIGDLQRFYYDGFGPGMYMSPDIKVNRRLCSICLDNIKKCAHVPGYMYNGIACRVMLRDVELTGASLVKNPRDPRCRIWPWQMNESDRKCDVLLLTFFSVDDFLQEDDWPKPSVKWPRRSRKRSK